ncbi:cupin domain-containing protein [Pseudalkalibacillus hwajinpoensis]|uniref:Cupin domain-containing protein n=1 Tax=Guptibacillus hwajinpoensis TaxID=208199 RepID=A0A4U1MPN2_9BACL|nr:cupin domain-containing protein [Pseudalkalibacillus hwajinpoensis]TKD72490.1 cupin domain-containing protein [Pseudalkalibacillus hwajinpoensis]
MEIYNFKRTTGKEITKFGSQFIMSRITQTESSVHIGAMYLDKDNIIGYHQAVTPQLLLILSGEGWVRGEEDELVKVSAGDAVFWNKDEWHETTTEEGLTAIAIEGELDPAKFMSIKEEVTS